MACACGSKTNAARRTFLVTLPDGTKQVKNSESEAQALVARKGGTYKIQ
jgi:hypothetical protein